MRHWKDARTVADLGNLTANWLEGRGSQYPAYGDPRPAEETAELIPALTALNRSGFLTDNSQPGEYGRGYDGRIWTQLPFVTGFVARDNRQLVKAIQRDCRAIGLVVVIDGRRDDRRPGGIPAVLVGDEVPMNVGTRVRDRDLRNAWAEDAPHAVAALLASYQVTVIDLEGERTTRMWDVLIRVAAKHGGH